MPPVKGEYGWPKMWKELVAGGYRVGKERVRGLMKKYGIRARSKRKFVVTTDSKHHLPIATDEGRLYLAADVDLFSRQVVGWSMQAHMQSSLVTDAPKVAWLRRNPAPGLIFHSDRGRQCCRHGFEIATRRLAMDEVIDWLMFYNHSRLHFSPEKYSVIAIQNIAN